MKWQGKGVSEGLAMAQIHLFTPKLPEISRQPAADAEAEVAKLEATLAAAEEELRGLYETAKEKMGEQEAEIFDAHLTILGDEYSVREPIIQRIREQKQNAAAAITDQFDELAQMFRSLGDELMAERAAMNYYKVLMEKGYFNRLIAGGILQTTQVDSVVCDMNAYPYRARAYATQKIVRESTVTERSLVTTCTLIDAVRSDANPQGFLIGNLTVVENKDLRTYDR